MRQIGKSKIEYPDTYIVLDTETTGLSASEDHLIEVAAIKYVDHKEIAHILGDNLKEDTHYVSDFITQLTGITNEMLKDARGEKDVLKDFIEFIGDNVIIGHNVRFDIGFIYEALLKDFGVLFQNDYIDTLRIARKLLHNDLERYRLKDLADYYEIDYSHAHRAICDVEITHDCYEYMMENLFDEYGTIENYMKKSKK